MPINLKLPSIFTRKRPKTLGGLIDRLYEMRAARLEENERFKLMKKAESELVDVILDEFPKVDLEKASGKLATGSVTGTDVPNVTDWDALEKFIKKNDAFDLLQRRCNTAAFQDRWDDKAVIPGVEVFRKIGLSLTKR